MFKKIAVCILPFIFMPLMRLTKDIILFLLPKIFVRRHITIITHSIINICLMLFVVYLFRLICYKLSIEPPYLLIWLTVLLVLIKSYRETVTIEKGYSLAEAMTKDLTESQGEKLDTVKYRRLLQTREWCNFGSSLIGIWSGVFIFWY